MDDALDEFTLTQLFTDFEGRSVSAVTKKEWDLEPIDDFTLTQLFTDFDRDLVGNNGPFYKRPLGGAEDKLRFSSQAVGVNKLSTIIKTMAEKAGMKGKYTNHSGKRSCATTLFQNGVDEQLIMGRTGHRSNAVRAYKRPSQSQERHVSELLDPPKKAVKVEPESAFTVKTADPPVPVVGINPTLTPREALAPINISNCTVNIFSNQ